MIGDQIIKEFNIELLEETMRKVYARLYSLEEESWLKVVEKSKTYHIQKYSVWSTLTSIMIGRQESCFKLSRRKCTTFISCK